MKKNNKIKIPKGYEIDIKQSTEHRIVLLKIELPLTWEAYCDKMRKKSSCSYDNDFKFLSSTFSNKPLLCVEFADKEDVEAFVAFFKLLHLRKAWVGDWKPNWMDRTQKKFTIVVEENELVDGLNTGVSCSMSFPTEEMRDKFIETFKDLLEQAKSLL